MARLYGQLVEKFGFREVREVSRAQVHDFLLYLQDARRAEDDPEAGRDAAQGGEISVEQYEEMVARMKADAERYGRARPNG